MKKNGMTFLFVEAVFFIFIVTTCAYAAEIVVPRDYASIQAAVDAAQPEDTIKVNVSENGYEEIVHLKDGVKLVGEADWKLEKPRIIIPPSSPQGTAVLYTANNTWIKNLKIDGYGNPDVSTYAVELGASDNVTIESCELIGTQKAINGASVDGLTLKNVSAFVPVDTANVRVMHISTSASNVLVENSILSAIALQSANNPYAISLPENASNSEVKYSCINGRKAGAFSERGNLYAGPQFANASYPADLMLDISSPCIRSGLTAGGTTTDMGTYVTLENGPSVNGYVTDDSNGTPKPLKGAAVTLYDTDKTQILGTGTTDASGYFEIRAAGIIKGSYIVAIDKPGYTSYEDTVYVRVVYPANVVTGIYAAHFINIEAEDMDSLSAAHSIVTGAANSWGRGHIVSAATSSSHKIYIPKTAQYALWVRLSDENDSKDSAEISLDGGSSYILVGDENGNTPASLRWVDFERGNPSYKITIPLSQGENTIIVRGREPGTKIDSIIITNNLAYIPPDTPPTVTVASWTKVIANGLDNPKNHESKLKSYKGSLYISTSNSSNKAAAYKMDTVGNYAKVFEYKSYRTDWRTTPNTYSLVWNMFRTLGLEYLSLPNGKSGLYALTDTGGTSHITKIDDGQSVTYPIGYFYRYDNSSSTYFNPRGYWTSGIIGFNDYAYAGFYNDAQLYFTMRRTQDPMKSGSGIPVTPENAVVFPAKGGTRPAFELPWTGVSEPAFGFDPNNPGRYYGNKSATASCVFKGKLYVATATGNYFGRINTGAQIWRTDDTPYNWECVVNNGFGDQYFSISKMAVFGGYLYAAGGTAFDKNYLYRTDGVTDSNGDGMPDWQNIPIPSVQGAYFGDMMPYMGRLYLITYNNPRVYSSADGVTWEAVSDTKFNDTNNSLFADMEIYCGNLYVAARNGVTGTQIWQGEVK